MSRKLHIGGAQPSPGWEILNAMPNPWVDHLGDARDLSQFPDNTFSDVYASHVLEHMDYIRELTDTLAEWRRVLQPGGRLYISVPDMDVLARLFLDRDNLTVDDRFDVMRMIFGGHMDKYDYHLVGLNQDFLIGFLSHAGYTNLCRVEKFSLFQDTSIMVFKGVAISINLIAEKPLT